MTPAQKKKIAWAVGITAVGVLLVSGVAVAASRGSSAGSSGGGPVAPAASDADVDAVVSKALVVETDPDLLRQLARAMMIFPYSNPLHNKIGALQARADALEAGRPQYAQPISGVAMTLAQAALAASKNG